MREQPSATAVPLLAVAALIGLGLAAAGLLGSPGSSPAGRLPSGAVAVVNGRVLPAAIFERALESLKASTRGPVGADQRRVLLERLVEEELLVQQGLALGLLELDRKLRGDLVHAVIDHAIAAAAVGEASSAELAEFYADNADLFRQADALLLHQVFLRVDDTADAAERVRLTRRAERVRARLLDGEDIGKVADELGDTPVLTIPHAYLRPAKLRDYLGATALRAVVALEVGGVSLPLRSVGGLHLYQLAGRRPAAPSSLDSNKELVASEYRRRRDDETLRALITNLRRSAAISLMDNP